MPQSSDSDSGMKTSRKSQEEAEARSAKSFAEAAEGLKKSYASKRGPKKAAVKK